MTNKVKREKDDLSEEELNFIQESDGKCPDCEIGELTEGPQGRVSRNYFCSNCGLGLNLAFSFSFSFSQLIWGHRISNKK